MSRARTEPVLSPSYGRGKRIVAKMAKFSMHDLHKTELFKMGEDVGWQVDFGLIAEDSEDSCTRAGHGGV